MGANLLAVAATLVLQSSPHDTSTTGSLTHGFGFERLTDLFQYNRVQGLSLGLGYRVTLSGTQPVGWYGTVRYGLSDERITGRLTWLRSGRGGALVLSAYSDIADLDPFSPGRTYANTFNGLFAGHDNGDYALAGGGSVSFGTPLSSGLELVWSGRIEHQSSIGQVAQSEVNDALGGTGRFPPNPPVDEGTYAAGSVTLRHVGVARWNLTAALLGGAGQASGRLFGDFRRDVGSGLGMTLRVKAGIATEPTLAQSLFRLGGLNTVRGFEYGTLRAPAFWAAQVDITPFQGRVRPVVFIDAGQAARTLQLFSSSVLVGAGAGLSLFSGLIRFDISRPVRPDQEGKVRFDLVIQGVR